jgi:hypothetical protein
VQRQVCGRCCLFVNSCALCSRIEGGVASAAL